MHIKYRKVDHTRKPVGKSNPNPFLDTRRYIVEVEDSLLLEYDNNFIAKNIYSKTNDKGPYITLLKNIIDHRKPNDALTHEDSFYVSKSGHKSQKYTTKGWRFCCE